jgi:hypothetical protein
MRSALAERCPAPRSNHVAVCEHRPATDAQSRRRIQVRFTTYDRLTEIRSKSDRLLGGALAVRDHARIKIGIDMAPLRFDDLGLHRRVNCVNGNQPPL